jgi:hypothetical protein
MQPMVGRFSNFSWISSQFGYSGGGRPYACL